MKIKRIVNGIEMEFELTPSETNRAFLEQQHYYDEQDILSAFDVYDDSDDVDRDKIDEELIRKYGGTYEEMEPLISDMAYQYRHYLDNNDDWTYLRDSAIEYIVKKNKK